MAATLAESRRLTGEATKRLKAERGALECQRRADEAELRRLAAAPAKNGEFVRLADVQERICQAERRLTEVENELALHVSQDITEDEVAAALGQFDDVWAEINPKEQARVLALLIERVDHDGESGNVAIMFLPCGIKALANQVAEHGETAA